MIKIYVIWHWNALLNKETVVGWDKDKKQAELKKPAWPAGTMTVKEYTISQEALDSLRAIRLEVAVKMLNDVPETIKKIKADPANALMIRHELNSRKVEIEARLSAPAGVIFDDEIDRYLHALEAGVV